MARYFRLPFAAAGDKTTIPDATQPNGIISYNQGYGPQYSLNPSTDAGARRIERNMFNQLMFDVTSTLQLYYQTGVPPFITAAQNGGTAYPYNIRSRVLYDSGSGIRIYESRRANNTSLPTVTTHWTRVDVESLDDRFVQVENNLDDLDNVATARTNLGIGAFNTGQSSLSASGYYRMPGGFIVQWLQSATLNPGQVVTRNWPIAYPNACLSAVCEDLNRTDSTLNISFAAAPTRTSCRPSNEGGGSTKTYWVYSVGH